MLVNGEWSFSFQNDSLSPPIVIPHQELLSIGQAIDKLDALYDKPSTTHSLAQAELESHIQQQGNLLTLTQSKVA